MGIFERIREWWYKPRIDKIETYDNIIEHLRSVDLPREMEEEEYYGEYYPISYALKQPWLYKKCTIEVNGQKFELAKKI